MKYFKKPDNSIWAYELDGSQDYLVTADMEPCEEPVPTPPPVPTYQELRAAAYPPIADYLDGIVKGDAAQVQAYVDTCLAVKAKYPKA